MAGSKITVLSTALFVFTLMYYGVYNLPSSLFANPLLSPLNSALNPTISWFNDRGINFMGVPLVLGLIVAIVLTLLLSHEVNKTTSALTAGIKEML